jgi:hypothetical protein
LDAKTLKMSAKASILVMFGGEDLCMRFESCAV